MKPSQFPNKNPWPPQQQRVIYHVDDSNSTLSERGGTAGQIYGYSLSPAVFHGTVAGLIHENAVGSLAGPVGGVVAMDGAGAGKSVKEGSCVGIHGGTLVDHTPGQIGSHTGQLYGPRGDAAVHDRLASHTYAYRPSSYLEGSGSTGLPNTIRGDAYWPTPYMESSKGLRNNISGDANQPPPYMEASGGLPNTIAGEAYRPPPYSEGSTGLPNTIPAPYQFADTVPATELYQSSGSLAVCCPCSSFILLVLEEIFLHWAVQLVTLVPWKIQVQVKFDFIKVSPYVRVFLCSPAVATHTIFLLLLKSKSCLVINALFLFPSGYRGNSACVSLFTL
ncbi:hypothetical protein HAX54_041004 [Datura stramonium]|uniref:Uncharacterized protein n=1 Tax=Datura stramonium TaxID=4076 RepID=A0ABS8VS51_DATST|nr:hypothetical protein [Datura stramonium]